MQPGLPTHQANPSRTAVGLIPLTVSPRQPLPDQATVRVMSQSGTAVDCLPAQHCISQGSAADPINAAQSLCGQGGIGAPAVVPELAVIDLCSPVKQSLSHQRQQQQQQQHSCSAAEDAVTAHKPPEHQPLTMDAPAPLLAHHAQLMSEDTSLSQAGKLAMADLHDNRPAGPFHEALNHQIASLNGTDSQHAPTTLTSQTVNRALDSTQGASDHGSTLRHTVQHLEPADGDPGAGRLLTQQILEQNAGAGVKALLMRQGSTGHEQAAETVTAPALTQAEVIEAQTADQEKPMVSFCCCLDCNELNIPILGYTTC